MAKLKESKLANFSLEATIAGRKTPIKSKTVGAGGGMSLTVKQRSNGNPLKTFTLTASANSDNTLLMVLSVPGKDDVTFHTPR